MGSRTARGLQPGPSVLRKWPGTNRHGGTLGVSFAPRVEWLYDPPCYGELGWKQAARHASHALKDPSAGHLERRRQREE